MESTLGYLPASVLKNRGRYAGVKFENQQVRYEPLDSSNHGTMGDNNPADTGRPHPIFDAYSSLPKPVKKMPNFVLGSTGLEKHLSLVLNSPLRKKGWFQSYGGLPQGTNTEPLPWYSYPAIDFIEERISPEIRVFEYGSGSSTQWYARLANEVIAVEHDIEWVDRVREFTPPTATIVHSEGKAEYVNSIAAFDDFDIVVIDGEFRTECAMRAPDHVSDAGVIIWDDTYNNEITSGYRELRNEGFKEIFFQGMGPVTPTEQRTSIFYREDNCFDI